MGYMVYMDSNGDAEGNYTLIARNRSRSILDGEIGRVGAFGLYPVGDILMAHNSSQIPVSLLHSLAFLCTLGLSELKTGQ